MNEPVTHSWAFGGPLTDAPPEAGWTILAGVAVLCAAFAWVSYRHAVRRLGVGPSALLTLLRTALLALLLLCLANPVRIERTTTKPPEPPPLTAGAAPRLAVVVDRSDSMTLPDNRGRSRLDEALANWRRLEKVAQAHFGPTDYFSFAEDLKPARTLQEAATRQGRTGETRLHQSISSLLKSAPAERPDALVVLTDGVDTSSDSEALLRESAIATGVPVYFVAGSNRAARPEPFVRVRELRVPATAQRRSEFTVEATFEAFSRSDRTVPFSLWQSGRRLLRGEVALTMGSNVVSRTFSVHANEAGPVDFTLRLGADDEAPPAARAITQVLSQQEGKVRVLIHQSTLDWGLRYFTTALRTDPTFEYFTIVTANVGLTLAGGSQPGSTIMGQLPDSTAPLTQFHCVVLVRPSPRTMTAAQQEALIGFVRSGGTLLFMSPDAQAMAQFQSSQLKNLLPVYLAGEVPQGPGAPALSARDLASRVAAAVNADADQAGGKLTPFSLTDAGRASSVFAKAGGNGTMILPRFLEYVLTFGARPAAEVLAVHPTATDAASGAPRILLATQTFGLGRSALLTTDTLWRWKLDEPSESRSVETFWQQLLLAISRRPEKRVLQFSTLPPQVRAGQVTTLRLGGATGETLPTVTAQAPDGRMLLLAVTRTGDSALPWSVEWTPDRTGQWEISAQLEGAHRASVFTTATAEVTGELAPSAPALDLLRTLAGETGGALLSHEAPAAWRGESERREKKPDVMTAERTTQRWNHWTLLSAALGCLALELVLRRFWKLL